MTLIKKIPSTRHGQPTIKDGAVRIFDHKTSRVYVYGGVPWDGNPDRDSPTRLASSSFHALEINKGMTWMDYSHTLYYNSLPRRVPFEFLGHYEPEELEHVDLSSDAGLPCLYGASGLLIDDKVSHNRYIIIFGVNKERAEMSLFCVNVTIQKWMYLTLDGEEKKRLRFGSQIALSGVGTDNVLLHVFGGRSSDGRYLEDYLVADLRRKQWLPIPVMPDIVMPLGCSPCALSIQGIPGHEGKMILLRGQEENLVATFAHAFILDATTSEFDYPDLGEDELKPPPMNTFVMHSIPDSISTTQNKWSLIGWTASDEIDNSAYEDVDYDMRFKATTSIQIWQLVAKLCEHTVERRDSPPPQAAADNDSSYILRQTARRSKPFTGNQPERTPRIERGEAQEIYRSSFTLTWRMLSVDRVRAELRNLDETFAVEYAVWLDCDMLGKDARSKLGPGVPFGPSILLLGYLPKFAGEVKARSYNAYAIIPLDRDDIDAFDEDEFMSQSSVSSSSSASSASESAIRVTRGRIVQDLLSDEEDTMSIVSDSQQDDMMSVVAGSQQGNRPSADTLIGSPESPAIKGKYTNLHAGHPEPVRNSRDSYMDTSPLDPEALANGLHQSVENAALQHGAMYSTTDYGEIEIELDDKDEGDSASSESESSPL